MEFPSFQPALLANAYAQTPATRSPHRATRTCVFRFGLPTRSPDTHSVCAGRVLVTTQLFILTNGHLTYLPAHVHGTYLTSKGFSRTAKQFPLCVSLCVRVCVCVKFGWRAPPSMECSLFCVFFSSSRAAAQPAQSLVIWTAPLRAARLFWVWVFVAVNCPAIHGRKSRETTGIPESLKIH